MSAESSGLSFEILGMSAREAIAWATAFAEASPTVSEPSAEPAAKAAGTRVSIPALTFALQRAPNDRGGDSDVAALMSFLGIPGPDQPSRLAGGDAAIPIERWRDVRPSSLTSLPPLDVEVEEILTVAISLSPTPEVGTRQILAAFGRVRPQGPLDRLLADLGDDAVSIYDLLLERGKAPSAGEIGTELEARLLGLRGALATPTPTDRITVMPLATSDEPTSIDLLGFSPLANSLVALLRLPETNFPLTIAVSGPWGGGKSSLLRLIEDRLTLRTREGMLGPVWTIARFPAWRYEPGEQLWAALAKCIYDAALRGRSWWGRLRFRLRLEGRRANWRLVFLKGAIATVGGIVGAVAGSTIAPVLTDANDAATPIIGGLGVLGGIVAVFRAFWGNIADPFKRTIESLAGAGADPKDGPGAEAIRNIDELLRMVLDEHAHGSRDRPLKSGLAILVDDLDRCSPRSVVRLVEAINQIFASDVVSGPNRRIAFVLAMDRQVVAASVEAEYSAIVASLGQRVSSQIDSYGLSFLDKIVQLWVSVPFPSAALLKTLARGLAGDPATQGGGPHDVMRVNSLKLRMLAEAETQGNGLADLARVARQIEQNEPGDPDTRAAVRRARQEAYSSIFASSSLSDSPEIQAALDIGVDCLDRNPRQVKRYLNAFRLQLHVAASSPDFTFAPDQLSALAKWVAVRLRWPALAQTLDGDPDLLMALEREANPKRALPAADVARAEAARSRHPELFDAARLPELSTLLATLKVRRKSQLMHSLPFDAFLRVS